MELPLSLTRSVVTIIVPGIVICAPALLLLIDAYPSIGSLYNAYKGPANVCSFALVVVVGAIVEMAVSYVEKRWDGLEGKSAEPVVGQGDWVERGWYEYLSRKFGDAEPVGYRYLSKTVTSMYFELGMFVSVPAALTMVGLLLIRHNAIALAVASFVIGVLSAWRMYKSAKDTHGVLCSTRAELNHRLK
jgi:hypothetical protein